MPNRGEDNAYGYGYNQPEGWSQGHDKSSGYGYGYSESNGTQTDAYGYGYERFETGGSYQDDGYGYGSSDSVSYSYGQNAYDSEAASKYSRSRYGSGQDVPYQAAEQRPSYTQSPAPSHVRSASTDGGRASGVSGAAHASVKSTDVYPEIARVRRRNRRIKRAIGIVVGVLVAAVVGVGAYALWFTNALDRALAPDQATTDALADVLVPQVDGQPYYALIVGSDSREGNFTEVVNQKGDNERSDVTMLVRIDPEEKKITMLSIPRDTPYRLEDGSFVKINEMFNELGVNGTIRAVSELTGLPISHHMEIRISGLENVVDLLGGVVVDVPTELSYKTTEMEEVTIEAGRQRLNGEQAQIFARARHEFVDNQDAHRQDNVRQLLQAIITSITDRPITEIPGLVLQLAEYIDTDYRTMDAVALAMAFSGSDITMYSATGPTDGDINTEAGNKWLCYQNPEGWQAIVDAVDAGEDPSELDIDFTETQILWTDVYDQPEFVSSMAHKYYYGI